MELSPELFDDITGISPAAVAAAGPESDRREHRRFAFGSRAVVQAFRNGAAGPETAVLLRDISLAGVGFLHSDQMKAGEQFVVQFTAKSGKLIKLQCAANRSEAGGSGGTQFVIGGTFQKLLEVVEPVSHAPAPKQETPAPSRPSRLFGRHKAPAHPEPAAAPPAAPVAHPPAPVPSPAPAPAPVPHAPVPAPAPVPVEHQPQPVAPSPVVHHPEPVPPHVEPAPATPSHVDAPAVAPSMPAEARVWVDQPLRIATDHPAPAPVPLPANCSPDVTQSAAKHQEVIATVKARLLRQNQDIQTQLHQLKSAHQEINAQKETISAISRERDEAAKAAETLQAEVATLRQALAELQAKTSIDDQLIDELAAIVAVDSNTMAHPVAA